MSDDLLIAPRWKPEQLGLPMPDDRDAVSACLPLWSHNIGYEEADPAVMDRLQAAYPRFCIHPDVQELCSALFEDSSGLPFVSAAAAERAVKYVRHAGGSSATARPIDEQSCVAVSVSDDELPLLKQYWQHAGELVSSRAARLILNQQPVSFSETEPRSIVRSRIGKLHQVSADNVFLFSAGMGAIAGTWRAINSLAPNRPTCQFGFPYVDTLKIQERFPGATSSFLPFGTASDAAELAELFLSHQFSAVFCETPTNPLLLTPDLQKLRRLTKKHDAMLVVDDTLRACSRHSVLPDCDVVVTSLTKYFSGYGNVLAGALVVNPDSKHATRLLSVITGQFEETLSDLDVAVLEQNSRDLQPRVQKCVNNARELVTRLRQHAAVADVFYPEWNDEDDPGSGALLSVVLRDAARVTARVFDQLRISKGPNLGTNFTLCCPYTILAHYAELDFAEHCGASRWLLRLSVGIEPVEELWDRLTDALNSAV